MEPEEEQWKPIPNMPGEASNRGRIRRTEDAGGGNSCRWKRGYVYKDHEVPGGYRQVRFAGRPWLVHRLVALAWVGPQPTPEHQINHKNKIRWDNRPENLEWVTCSENHRHAFQNGRKRSVGSGTKPGTTPNLPPPPEVVRAIVRLRGKMSQKKIGAMFGLKQTHVSKIQLENMHST